MEQIELEIVPRLAYRADTFLLHQGVAGISRDIIKILSGFEFKPQFILGAPRSGKTHLSLYLQMELEARERPTQLIEAGTIPTFDLARANMQSGSVLIVDDLQQYLKNLGPGQSGPFVNFYEACKRNLVGLVFLSSEAPGSFPVDEHIRSRLLAATFFEIGRPSDEDMTKIIECLCLQRGLAYKPRKLEGISKRTGRSIEEIELGLLA